MRPARRAAVTAMGLAACVGALAATRGAACAQTVAPSEGAGANPEAGPARPTGATIADAPPGAVPPAPPSEPPAATEPALPPPPAEPTTATLRVEALAPGQQFDVQFVSPNGTTQTALGVRAGHPVTLRDLAPGTSTVRVSGAATFERHVDLDTGRSILRLTHAPARNGVVWGAISLVAGLALAGGTVAIAAPCINNACDVESQTAFAIPMGLLGAAGIGLGIAMLAWRMPEQNEAAVELDFSDESARRAPRRIAAPSVLASIAPAPGGALATAAARF